MFGALYAAEGSASEVLVDVAREFSPRIEACGPRAFDSAQARELVLDLSGLTRLFGDARTIAEELRRTAADRGLQIRVAIAGTRTAARLLVRHRAGLTVIEPGAEAEALASLPIALLGEINSQPPTPNSQAGRKLEVGSWELGVVFRRWGLRTLGDLAELPPDDVAARLGQPGVQWQRLSRGEDPCPLVPAVPEERFEQALDLEWPIEELEPLSFVLGRLMEPLSAHLERRGRGAAVLHVRLHLIKTDGVTREVHERSLQLPIPIRDARTLRTLALVDLESNPPPAAIDRVVVAVDPTPGRIVQFSLLTRPLPSPEQISTLMARLHALMGETRCGAPAQVDSWQPGAFAMKPFAPLDFGAIHSHEPRRHGGAEAKIFQDLRASASPWPVEVKDAANSGAHIESRIPNPESRVVVALRRFRVPVPARVRVEHGRPARVMTGRCGLSGGGVEACAGPWRTSGGWWRNGEGGSPYITPWDRDEWDVTLAGGATYRLFRSRDRDQWFVDGVVD